MKRNLTQSMRPRRLTTIISATALLAYHTLTVDAKDLGVSLPEPIKLDQLAANIEAGLHGRCVGFGYAIFKDGQFARGGGGGTREKTDSIFGSHPFDENTQKDCHSMSKTITAAAMIKALQSRAIGLDAKIYDYFPKVFQDATPNDARQITFEQMLSHRSGFADSAKTWGQLLNELQAGLDFAPDSKTDYSNWNYGMCRLLIPYVTQIHFFRAAEKDRTEEELAELTADMYIEYVRNNILKPAGAHATRTRPPANPTASNFAYLYDFAVPEAEGLMPNRHLDIGSGGWAMSAKTYGRFIDALFEGELVGNLVKVNDAYENTLDYMQSENLGMWRARGSNNAFHYRHTGANSWSAGNHSVGGQSVWCYFPENRITVVVQVNSHKNAITAAGIPRAQMVQEAYDNVYSIPKARSATFPVHMFFGRSHDGWQVSRGVFDDGDLGSGNFDTKGEVGWNTTRFFEANEQSYVLNYQIHSGRLMVRKVNGDGTFGPSLYNHSTIGAGWTHLEVFYKNPNKRAFLVLYNQNEGRVRTHRLGIDGKPDFPAITDAGAQEGFDIVKIVHLSGEDHLFRHNSSTGFTHVRSLDSDGSWGPKVYEKTWKNGFTDFQFYRAGNQKMNLLRYTAETGRANILEFPPTVAGLNQTNQVLDQQWTRNWTKMRFFETSEGTFNFRYSAVSGDVRIQKIRSSNGSFGEVVLESNSRWLKATPDLGTFSPATHGWDQLEFYEAKAPNFVVVEGKKPPRADVDDDAAPPLTPTPVRERPDAVEPTNLTLKSARGGVQMQWQGSRHVSYVVEKSQDLQDWRFLDVVSGVDGVVRWNRSGDESPANQRQAYYRVRTLAIPTLKLNATPLKTRE